MAFSSVSKVPISLQGCTSEQCQNWCKEVKGSNHQDRKPDNDSVQRGEVQHEQPGADGPLQKRNGNDVCALHVSKQEDEYSAANLLTICVIHR
jgi:hypothetical protein